MIYYAHINTPAGELLLVRDNHTVTGLHWKIFKRVPVIQANWVENKDVFTEVIQQLSEYFAGKRQLFTFDYAAKGTDFQMKVWRELQKIPFGQKSSYQAIANIIGKPKAVRAVGTAVGSNPISIVVPCHRILTSSDKLGGYAGGLPAKQVLLQAENITWKSS
jgi:O-6-methylguanine DNA methyltransferase